MLHSLVDVANFNDLGSLGHAIQHTLGEWLGLGLHVDNGSEGRGNKEKLHRGGLCNRGRWGVWNGEFWVEELLFLTPNVSNLCISKAEVVQR